MVTVVVTVFNEERTIDRLVQALLTQTHKADDLVFVDGGSTDNTVKILKNYKKLKVYIHKSNRSQGRNFGVQQAKSQIIAFTDAGCVPHPDWLEKLVTPFTLDKTLDVVAGFYRGIPATDFEACLIPYVLVMPDRAGSDFLPSTRSMAIKKKVFLEVNGFDTERNYSEDYKLAFILKAAHKKFVFIKDAIVDWMPNRDYRQAAIMFLQFALNDIQAGIFRPKVRLLLIRYYLFFFLLFLSWWMLLLIPVYLVWAIFKNYKYVKRLSAFWWLPVLQITADAMVIMGTTMGFLVSGKISK